MVLHALGDGGERAQAACTGVIGFSPGDVGQEVAAVGVDFDGARMARDCV